MEKRRQEIEKQAKIEIAGKEGRKEKSKDETGGRVEHKSSNQYSAFRSSHANTSLPCSHLSNLMKHFSTGLKRKL